MKFLACRFALFSGFLGGEGRGALWAALWCGGCGGECCGGGESKNGFVEILGEATFAPLFTIKGLELKDGLLTEVLVGGRGETGLVLMAAGPEEFSGRGAGLGRVLVYS